MAKRFKKRIKRPSQPNTRRRKGTVPKNHRAVPKSPRLKARARRVKRPKLDYSIRYSKEWSSHRVQPHIHSATHSLCCWCHKRPSTEIHHAAYQDAEGKVKDDEIKRSGILLFPLCDRCHIPILHNNKYWVTDAEDPIWKNHNTDEALKRLQLGYQILSKGVYR